MAFINCDSSFDFALAICHDCGFLFQDSAYSPGYDQRIRQVYEQFYKSSTFEFPQRSKANLDALEMILSHLPGKKHLNILEIGSNRGDLLFLLKEKLPHANILGIEPSHFDNLQIPTIHGVFNKEMFSNTFDLIIMQHVLEHIKNPVQMAKEVSQCLSENGIIYIEVPSTEKNLSNYIEDFSLEHVNYFTFNTLNHLFSHCLPVAHTCDWFIRTIWTTSPTPGEKQPTPPCSPHNQVIATFTAVNGLYQKKFELLKEITQHSQKGSKIVFYGISYYFRTIFKLLKPYIKPQQCFFIDDHFQPDHEPTFGIKRLPALHGDCTVILCSNNSYIQDQMEKNILSLIPNHITLVRPWSQMIKK